MIRTDDVCPYCGARRYPVPPARMSIREIVVNIAGVLLLVAILVPAWCVTERWLEQQNCRMSDHMVWRELID